MLFSSLEFIFLYLPAVFIGFIILARVHYKAAAVWLTAASFVFYGWWDVRFAPLLALSIVFNFLTGRAIAWMSSRPHAQKFTPHALAAGILLNLAALGYYKYAGFFQSSLNAALGKQILDLGQIILPLGISFFTFTQIAFLVDVYQGKAKEYNLVYYALFVTYFPHLIAGPVLHHGEMMPQFMKRETYKLNFETIAAGISIFAAGLFKKTVFADNAATFATPIFASASAGASPDFIHAWTAALAYTFQLYFDFSGYSDMAIGLSLMFGVRLPLNFHSPYKAGSIIDFWRRWHMSLSRFLRDYLYIPLGGSRVGPARWRVNLFLTMLLGGVWHGAGWTFIAWGALHGFYLVVNHEWRVRAGSPGKALPKTLPAVIASRTLTMICVIIGWVVFRSDSLGAAAIMLHSMFIPDWKNTAAADINTAAFIALLAAISLFAPNTQQIFSKVKPAFGVYGELSDESGFPRRLKWSGGWVWAFAAAVMLIISISRIITAAADSEFLYFQF